MARMSELLILDRVAMEISLRVSCALAMASKEGAGNSNKLDDAGRFQRAVAWCADLNDWHTECRRRGVDAYTAFLRPQSAEADPGLAVYAWRTARLSERALNGALERNGITTTSEQYEIEDAVATTQ